MTPIYTHIASLFIHLIKKKSLYTVYHLNVLKNQNVLIRIALTTKKF